MAPTEQLDWKVVGSQQPVFCAVIQDNGGDEAGSMIFDLESALRLAGALLMEARGGGIPTRGEGHVGRHARRGQ